jgi:hypothetical protein
LAANRVGADLFAWAVRKPTGNVVRMNSRPHRLGLNAPLSDTLSKRMFGIFDAKEFNAKTSSEKRIFLLTKEI